MLDINKPNVLIIYPDQLRYDAMSHTGNPVIKTPGFDRLACEGIVFENAYTSFPLCCPFRASLFTGKYAHKNGMYANHYPIPLNQEFLPEIMKKNGYKTGWIGKWHLNGGGKAEYVPEEYRLGFEHFVGFSRGHQYNTSVFYRNNDTTPRKTTMYEPSYQTGHLIEFIDEAISENKPFFVGICYGLPHPPLVAPKWYSDLYSPSEIMLSETVDEEDRAKAKEFMAKYYGLVNAVDTQVSTILDYLDRKGIANNTLVIFVSDHGELAYEHGRKGKRSYYESSMHVPFIIKYPKRYEGGKKIEHLVDPSVDIFPTILDMCGIELPDYVQGHSLLPLIENKDGYDKDFIYYQLIKQPFKEFKETIIPERGIRTKDYLYVSKNNVPEKFFDLKNDPNELNNLINKQEYQEIIEYFDNFLKEKMKLYEDDWNICFDKTIESFESHKVGSEKVKELYENAICENILK